MEAKKETPPIIDQLKEYVETRIKLAKLQAIESSSTVAAGLIADVAVVISMILAFLFASFTLALYLGKVLGDYWIGFGIVAVLYLILALLVKANKQRIEKPLANTFIQKIFKS
jgi:hypothetical protein